MAPNDRGYGFEDINATILALLGWTSVIVMVGMLPLHNFAGHAHWGSVQWTMTPRQWRSPKFYFDVVANIVLFIPFGLLLARQFSPSHRQQELRLVGVGLLLSLAIEYFQVFCHNRHPSLIDLVSNTIGTACGAWIAPRVFSFPLFRTWLPGPHSGPAGS